MNFADDKEVDDWLLNESRITLDTAKLADLGYGDLTSEADTVNLNLNEVCTLAESVGGTVAEILTAEVL